MFNVLKKVWQKSKGVVGNTVQKVRSYFVKPTQTAAIAASAPLFVSGTSAEAAVDVSAAITAFEDINTAVPLIGAAFLGALAILALWKLLRGAFA